VTILTEEETIFAIQEGDQGDHSRVVVQRGVLLDWIT